MDTAGDRSRHTLALPLRTRHDPGGCHKTSTRIDEYPVQLSIDYRLGGKWLSFDKKNWKLSGFYAELHQTLHSPVSANQPQCALQPINAASFGVSLEVEYCYSMCNGSPSNKPKIQGIYRQIQVYPFWYYDLCVIRNKLPTCVCPLKISDVYRCLGDGPLPVSLGTPVSLGMWGNTACALCFGLVGQETIAHTTTMWLHVPWYSWWSGI